MTDKEEGSVIAQLSDDEFQFFKNKLQTQVKQYLDLDEEIIAFRKAMKERNQKKKELSAGILELMKKLEIDDLNVKNGKLVSKTTTTNKAINKQAITSGLNELFENDDNRVAEAIQFILEKREKVEKTSLRHVKNKAKKNTLSLE
jgi:cobalamin biosynthesis Mg chelatase CobN